MCVEVSWDNVLTCDEVACPALTVSNSGSSEVTGSSGVAPVQTGVVVCEGSIEAERDRDLDPCLDDDMAALMAHCALGFLSLLERLGSRGGSSMLKPTEGLVPVVFY